MILKPVFTLMENNKVDLVFGLCGVGNVCISDTTFVWLATKHNS